VTQSRNYIESSGIPISGIKIVKHFFLVGTMQHFTREERKLLCEDDERCISLFRSIGLLRKAQIVCSKCDSLRGNLVPRQHRGMITSPYNCIDGCMFRCTTAGCSKLLTIRVNSWFERRRWSLSDLFREIFRFLHDYSGFSRRRLSPKSKVIYTSLRKIICEDYNAHRPMVGGERMTVALFCTPVKIDSTKRSNLHCPDAELLVNTVLIRCLELESGLLIGGFARDTTIASLLDIVAQLVRPKTTFDIVGSLYGRFPFEFHSAVCDAPDMGWKDISFRRTDRDYHWSCRAKPEVLRYLESLESRVLKNDLEEHLTYTLWRMWIISRGRNSRVEFKPAHRPSNSNWYQKEKPHPNLLRKIVSKDIFLWDQLVCAIAEQYPVNR